MNTIDVIRAWKDDDYRASLSGEQLTQLPANPAGGIEVLQSDRDFFEGGRRTVRGGNCTRDRGC